MNFICIEIEKLENEFKTMDEALTANTQSLSIRIHASFNIFMCDSEIMKHAMFVNNKSKAEKDAFPS